MTSNGRNLNAVLVKIAAFTVVAAIHNAAIFSTQGAAGVVTFSLPAATVGQRYGFHVGAVQELRIDPNGTEKMSLPSTGALQAAGKYLSADAIGEFVEITCVKAGEWIVTNYIGTWTVEA